MTAQTLLGFWQNLASVKICRRLIFVQLAITEAWHTGSPPWKNGAPVKRNGARQKMEPPVKKWSPSNLCTLEDASARKENGFLRWGLKSTIDFTNRFLGLCDITCRIEYELTPSHFVLEELDHVVIGARPWHLEKYCLSKKRILFFLTSPKSSSSSDSVMRTPTLSKAPRRSFLSIVPSWKTELTTRKKNLQRTL